MNLEFIIKNDDIFIFEENEFIKKWAKEKKLTCDFY